MSTYRWRTTKISRPRATAPGRKWPNKEQLRRSVQHYRTGSSSKRLPRSPNPNRPESKSATTHPRVAAPSTSTRPLIIPENKLTQKHPSAEKVHPGPTTAQRSLNGLRITLDSCRYVSLLVYLHTRRYNCKYAITHLFQQEICQHNNWPLPKYTFGVTEGLGRYAWQCELTIPLHIGADDADFAVDTETDQARTRVHGTADSKRAAKQASAGRTLLWLYRHKLIKQSSCIDHVE